MKSKGFTRLIEEPCIFKKDDTHALVYVDDIIMTGGKQTTQDIRELDFQLSKDPVDLHDEKFVGPVYQRTPLGMFVSTSDYVTKHVFHPNLKGKPPATPLPFNVKEILKETPEPLENPWQITQMRKITGEVSYLANFRIDLAVASHTLSLFGAVPTRQSLDWPIE